MMKSFIALAVLTLSAQAQAVVIPKKITCTDHRGYQLVVEDTGMEGFSVALETYIQFKGQKAKPDTVRLSPKSTDTILVLDGNTENGNLLYITVDLKNRTAFRQTAANNGMSPLPGMNYSDCLIVK